MRKYLAKLDYNCYLPDYGIIGRSKDVLEQVRYLKDLRAEINKLIDKGLTREQIGEAIKMENYTHYDYQFLLHCEINAVYNELKIIKNVP